MRFLIPLAILAPVPALAVTELRCIPDKICIPGTCDVAITEEAALRMTHPDSAAPALRSHTEIVPMAKTFQHEDQSQWQGVNAAGEHEDLLLLRRWMEFHYTIGGPFVSGVGKQIRYRATGHCEEK